MKELIQIKTNEQGQKLVSARELHEGLEVKTRFNDWFIRMLQYGFEENTDFTAITQKKVTAQGNETTFTDYVITLDMAKEISMIQRNETGKKFRQYFIECEKQLQQVKQDSYMIADPIERAKRWIEEETVRQEQAKQLEEQKPLVQFANKVAGSSDCIDVGTFAKLIKDEGIKLGRNKLFEKLREMKILMKNNQPYQAYVDREYFIIKEFTYNTSYGEKIQTKTLITGKGQIWLTEKLRNNVDK